MRWLPSVVLATALSLWPLVTLAQTAAADPPQPLNVDPPALSMTGLVGGANMAASIRLLATQTVTGTSMLVTDLADQTGDGRLRDSVAASSITLSPASEIGELTAGSLKQVVIQLPPPPVAGTYGGKLIIHWLGPQPGTLPVSLTVTVRAHPSLAPIGATTLAMNGLTGGWLVHQITLRETTDVGEPLTRLQPVSQDLTSAEGNTLAAARLTFTPTGTTVASGGLVTVAVGVDASGLPAGAYQGQALFQSDNGALLTVPVAINVRDGPFWPFLLLIIGVLIGLYLASYRTQGKVRDELIVRAYAIRQALEGPDFNYGFGPAIGPLIEKAEADTRGLQFDEAKAALTSAEDLARKWRADPVGWTAQFNNLKSEILAKLDPAPLAEKELRNQAEVLKYTVAKFQTPTDLGKAILEMERQQRTYEAIRDRLRTIEQAPRPTHLSDAQTSAFKTREDALTQTLNTLPLADDKGWTQLQTDVQALGTDVAKAIDEAAKKVTAGAPELIPLEMGAEGAILSGLLSTLKSAIKAEVSPLPTTGPFTLEMARRAAWDSRLASALIYVLGGLLLALWGFQTLYLAKPTFGAQGVADYLALVAWGLGGQTTVTAAADLVRNWEFPFGKLTG
jgi:hypothetical protein